MSNDDFIEWDAFRELLVWRLEKDISFKVIDISHPPLGEATDGSFAVVEFEVFEW